ncbi:MAG: TolC family protein [Balneola sp.]
MKKIISLALLAILTYSGTTLGQNVQQITLQDAIRISLENNYLLKQAENNLDLANKNITSEYADFLPSLSSSLSASSGEGRTQVEVGDQIRTVNVVSNSVRGNISGSITIFNGFDNIVTLRSSMNAKLSREERLKRAKENVIFNTATRFLQVLLDKQLLEIAQENLATSQKQLEQVSAQVEVGSRPAVDLYNQEAQVANDELAITQRENSLNLNKLLLIRQLQIDPTREYEFINPLTDINTITVAFRDYELRTLIDEALAGRSDIKSEVADIENLKFQLFLSKMRLLPTISGNFGISSSYGDQRRFNGEPVSFSDQFFDREIGKSVGVSLNFPIFNNWNRVSNIQTSQVNLKNAQLSLENSELQVVQEVTQAYNDYTSFVKQLEASEKSQIASEKAFETQQERYNVGASTLIELSQAQSTYVEAQSNYTQAIYNLIFQEKLLDFYLGKLSGEDIEF